MKKIINILILVALVAIVVVQLKNNKNVAVNRVYHYDKEHVIIVSALNISVTEVDETYEFTGVFDAKKEAKVNADIQGKIIKYFVDKGSEVKSGQPLVKLDDELLQLQLEAINVKIEGFEADKKRYQVLTDADAIQGVKLEKTLIGLKAAEIQKKTVLTQISKTTIRAPFSGVVTLKMSEVGSFAAPGVPLVILTDISDLKFKVNVTESDLNLFVLHQTYKIQSDAYPEMTIEGIVTAAGSKGNMGNSFPIEFAIKNNIGKKIKSKMFGKVVLDDANQHGVITIPSSAIIGSDIKPSVYVIIEGKAVLRPITVAKRLQNRVVVGSGLKASDQIITSGFINLFEGANVTVR
jgi:RND family efflux transporter MFP subunit